MNNKLSYNLNKSIRNTQPTLRTIGVWRIEWVEKGLDRTMTFVEYRSMKYKEYHQNRKKKQLKVS